MIVYHGGTEVIEQPMVHIGRAKLDFGKGFYVTTLPYAQQSVVHHQSASD